MKRRFLYWDGECLASYCRTDGVPRLEARYAADAGGRSAFAAALADWPRRPMSLLIDVDEESYHPTTIPRLRGRERRAVIARRHAAVHPEAAATLALSLGHEPTGRRDERLMLVGLGSQAELAPWLAALHAADIPLSGIHAVSQFAARLAGPDLQPRRHIVFTVARQCLREHFVDRGVTVFSRRLALPGDPLKPEAGLIAAACALDAERLQGYLAGQGLIERDEMPPTVILAPEALCAALTAALTPDILAEAGTVTAVPMPIAGSGLEPFGPAYYLEQLARHAPAPAFANPEASAGHRRWLGRRVTLAASLGALVAAAPFSVGAAWQAAMDRETADAMHRQAQAVDRMATPLQDEATAATQDQARVRQAGAQFVGLTAEAVPLRAALQAAGNALATVEQAELAEIEWRRDGVAATLRLRGEIQADNARHAGLVFEALLARLRQDSAVGDVQVADHPAEHPRPLSPTGRPFGAEARQGRPFAVEVRLRRAP